MEQSSKFVYKTDNIAMITTKTADNKQHEVIHIYIFDVSTFNLVIKNKCFVSSFLGAFQKAILSNLPYIVSKSND